MTVRDAFRNQASHCAALGSPFMARLMTLAADRLQPGTPVTDRIFSWPGDASAGRSPTTRRPDPSPGARAGRAILLTMIVVQGVFRFAAGDRDRYLAESVETQRISRAEQGCLEYVLAADPVEPDRVVLSERWETRADLDAHVAALTERRQREAEAGATPITPLSRELAFLDATPLDMGL